MSSISIIFLIIGFVLLFIYFIGTQVNNKRFDKRKLKEEFLPVINTIVQNSSNKKQCEIAKKNQEIQDSIQESRILAKKRRTTL